MLKTGNATSHHYAPSSTFLNLAILQNLVNNSEKEIEVDARAESISIAFPAHCMQEWKRNQDTIRRL